jgi:hypothetical protein
VYYTTIWCQIEPGLAITAGSLATLRKAPALIRQRFGWTNNELAGNGSSGDDSMTVVGAPRKGRINDLSTTASEFSTRGARYVEAQKQEQRSGGQSVAHDSESEMTQHTQYLDSGKMLEDSRTSKRLETKTARGTIYESRDDARHGGKYDPPYGPNESAEEAIEHVDLEQPQPAPEVTRFCEADETWSTKGRRKNNRRDRDPT